MIKEVEEQITIKKSRVFCDICEKIISEGNICFEFRPAILHVDDSFFVHDEVLAVCSIKCLQSPTLTLLLNVKSISNMKKNYKEYQKNKIEESKPERKGGPHYINLYSR